MKENENNTTNVRRFNSWMRGSNTVRIISIGILILVLLIPASMIESLIWERKNHQENVIKEVSKKWGAEQTITGLILSVPFKTYTKNKHNVLIEQIEYAHFLPELLNFNGEIFTEKRYRSIYEVLLYNSKLKIDGEFLIPDFKDFSIENENILWKDAFISLGISDMKGIKNNLYVDWNDKKISFNAGLENTDIISSGVSVKVPVLDFSSEQKKHRFNIVLDLNGTGIFSFIPLGKETNLALNSKWKTPSFSGEFLPDSRDISEKGFVAEWKVLHLNRNFPQKWLNDKHQVSSFSFGVKLLIPANQYQQSIRSVKYAILFISLTFITFFFIEVLNKDRIHPIQYILVGLALCIFFVLLISISEHLSFNFAFILSSLSVTLLIALYSKAIFKNNKIAFLISGILIVLYGFIFTILQLEDYALLIGTLGLFIVLTLVMYFSRKINWYNIN